MIRTSAALTNTANSRRILRFGVIAFMLLVLTSCASNTTKTISVADTKVTQADIEISDSDKERFQSGLTALENGDDQAAEGIFLDLINDKPGLAGPYSNIAIINFKQGKYQEALGLTDKAIELSPGMAQAYNLRAQIKIKLGKIKEAETDYLKATELDSGYANAHYNLALLYDIYLQEIRKAIEHYETYMSLLPQPDKTTKEWINHLKGSLKNG